MSADKKRPHQTESQAESDSPAVKRQKCMPTHEIKAVLLDIEGTTTPITFVTEKLFPYVRRELRNYLTSKWSEEGVQADVAALRQLAQEDKANKVEGVVDIPADGDENTLREAVIRNVLWQMDKDRKSTALKSLQGNMWKFGYESGELKGEIYDDVFSAFKKWKEMRVPVYIYSSGSIAAQKLLFGYCATGGNLLGYLSGHFDTTIGAKVASSSYTNIARELQLPPEHILFVTDVLQEAEASHQAGLPTYISVRPGNKPLPDKHGFPTVTSFEQLFSAPELTFVSAASPTMNSSTAIQ